MTREEKELAIEELQGCIIAEEHGKDGKPNGNVTCELTKDTINLAIKALEQEPRWIPVSERLPRKEGDYLVTVRNKEYGFQYIDITTYEHSEWGYKDEWQVIAWMNAPGEYKAETETAE